MLINFCRATPYGIGLRKRPYYRYLIEKVTFTGVRISQSLPDKMAENS